MMNKSPMNLSLTADEHEILQDALMMLTEAYSHVHMDLIPDSDSYQRYEILESLRNRSYKLWSTRFTES